MSFAAVFLYEVDTGGHDAFQSVYAPDGDWAVFFAASTDFLGTVLLRSGDRYLVIDRWTSRGRYEAFLEANGDEYAARSTEAARLYLSETDLGRFETA
jgi:hypothetical protein